MRLAGHGGLATTQRRPEKITELRWLVQQVMDELALRHGAAPQVHLKCCRQKGGADEGQSLPLLTLDRSRTRLLRNLLDNASRQSDPAGQPLQLRCTSPMLAGGLVVEAVLSGTAF